MKQKWLLIFIVFLLNGCFIFTGVIKKRKAIKNCRFKIVRIENFSWNPMDPNKAIRVDVRVAIKNPEDNIDIILDKLDAELYVNDIVIAKVCNTNNINVAKGEEKDFFISVFLKMEAVNEAALISMSERKASYRIDGVAYFNTIFGAVSFSITVKEVEWTAPDEKEIMVDQI